DGRLRTASTLSGHTFNPSGFTLYPRNVPSFIPKANMSRLRLSRPHNCFRPFSVKVEPIVMVCSGYSGWIATCIFSSMTWFIMAFGTPGPETIVHSSGIIMLLRNVTVSPVTRNFSIPWAVDGTARILLTYGLPMISFSLIRRDSFPDLSISSIFLFKCIHSLVVCPTSPWNSQNLLAFLSSTSVVISGGGLNFPFSRARISFGVFVRRVNLSCFRAVICWFWKLPFLKFCLCPASCCFHDKNDFFRLRLEAATYPLRNAVVTLIISSTDVWILSCSRLISSGLKQFLFLWSENSGSSFRCLRGCYERPHLGYGLSDILRACLCPNLSLRLLLLLGVPDSECREGFVRNKPDLVLRSLLLPKRIPHDRRWLTKWSLLISAHGGYFRKQGCIRGPTDDANLKKPLALPWGRTPRLDSDVRVGCNQLRGSEKRALLQATIAKNDVEADRVEVEKERKDIYFLSDIVTRSEVADGYGGVPQTDSIHKNLNSEDISTCIGSPESINN
nr:hypothetical protein [Tanacetum cinerariifolium]